MADRTAARLLAGAAQDLIDRGEAPRALDLLDQSQCMPKADIFAVRATAHLALGDAGKALGASREALILDAQNAAAHFNAGRALLSLGEPEAAATAFAAAERGFPHVAEIAAKRGEAAYLSGDNPAAEAALRRAISRSPGHAPAFRLLTELLHQRTDHGPLNRLLAEAAAQGGPPAFRAASALARLGRRREALAALERVEAASGPAPALDSLFADLLREEGDLPAATRRARAAAAQAPADPDANAPLARLLLMKGAIDEAEDLARRMLAVAPLNQLWLAFLWTALFAQGSTAAGGLLDFDLDVGVVDFETPAGYSSLEAFNAALAAELEPFHRSSGAPLGQSVHGGSQTRRPLQTVKSPAISAFFAAAARSVENFLEGLPADGGHPFRRWKGTRMRIDAAWSVSLMRGGRHAAHVHPGGRISSAYYVELPSAGGAGDAGALALGWPPFPVAAMETPRRFITPKPGRLALFPSYCWH